MLDPDPGFTGTAARVPFRVVAVVRSDHGHENQVYLDSSLQVTVDPVTPTARDDTATTSVDRPVVVTALANAAAGASSVPLVGSSVRLRAEPGLPTGSTLFGDAQTLTVGGHGVFLVAGGGEITFVPFG